MQGRPPCSASSWVGQSPGRVARGPLAALDAVEAQAAWLRVVEQVQVELVQVQVPEQRLMVAPLAQRGMEPVVAFLMAAYRAPLELQEWNIRASPASFPVASRQASFRVASHRASQIAAAADTEDIQAGA